MNLYFLMGVRNENLFHMLLLYIDLMNYEKAIDL